MTSGQLVVLAAPSGAGKTSLVHALLQRLPDLRFSISYTTRPQRASEVDGKDYFFVSPERFEAMAADGAFLEYARVFDHCYGTGRAHVEGLLAEGFTVLLEIDWQGARQVRKTAPDAESIFVLPPSIAELERRLRGRGTDSAETIARRLKDSLGDMTHWQEFDYVIVNDDLAAAADELERIISGDGTASRTSASTIRRKIAAILDT